MTGECSPALEHGGRLEELLRLYPEAVRPLLDLSTGINPLPYPVGTLAAEAWSRLPEQGALAGLQEDAARAYGVSDAAMVVAAPGTQILISVMPHLLRARDVRVLGPTYGEHLAAWRQAGVAAREVLDVADLADGGCGVLCQPNNPDGRVLAPAVLVGLADGFAARGGVLIVDEAFADLTPEASVAGALPHPGLVILRSFGKVYGLAGLRLGFALASPALAGRLRTALGPWAVSGPAIAIGRDALRDRAWLLAAGARLEADGAQVDAVLTEAGLRVIGGTPLFRLTVSARAGEIFERLGRAGILVRRFGFEPTWLRFGIPGTGADLARLKRGLNHLVP